MPDDAAVQAWGSLEIRKFKERSLGQVGDILGVEWGQRSHKTVEEPMANGRGQNDP